MSSNDTIHKIIRLTAGEVSSLWSQYQSDTMASCVMSHFLAKVEDQDIRDVLEFSLQKSQEHIGAIQQIFNSGKFPIPIGFTGDDVNSNAPRLFTDVFVAKYLRHMAILGMAGGTLAFSMCARTDVSALFKHVIADAVELHDKARIMKLEKGIYTRPPAITTPDKVEYVSRQSFLGNIFGAKMRPLTVIEITHLFANIQTNSLGKAMMMGFAQVAKNPTVKEHMLRGKAIATKHIKLFSDVLINEDLPAPMTWDNEVTDSVISPFSDKLIMFHTGAMIAAGLGNYAASAAVSQRSDIGIMYARLMPEIALYGEDGMNVTIDNQWMEEPPQATDRNKLVLNNKDENGNKYPPA